MGPFRICFELFDLIDGEKVLVFVGDDKLGTAKRRIALYRHLKKGTVTEKFDELLGHQFPADGPKPRAATAAENDVCHVFVCLLESVTLLLDRNLVDFS